MNKAATAEVSSQVLHAIRKILHETVKKYPDAPMESIIDALCVGLYVAVTKGFGTRPDCVMTAEILNSIVAAHDADHALMRREE